MQPNYVVLFIKSTQPVRKSLSLVDESSAKNFTPKVNPNFRGITDIFCSFGICGKTKNKAIAVEKNFEYDCKANWKRCNSPRKAVNRKQIWLQTYSQIHHENKPHYNHKTDIAANIEIRWSNDFCQVLSEMRPEHLESLPSHFVPVFTAKKTLK